MGPERGWWLAAALVVLVDRILMFSYFIPTLIALMNAPDSVASVAAATRWMSLNYLRHALILGAWLAALKALSLRLEVPVTSAYAVSVKTKRLHRLKHVCLARGRP